ncbi:hypothetical protein UF75_1278 [Desulfosporosinus sp. I2]|nr:hypothetical protein UF75_1278 [Desulfosporosinus sp. I2]
MDYSEGVKAKLVIKLAQKLQYLLILFFLREEMRTFSQN